ncbi:hypothetical protein MKW92_029108 [Papaver armeniacum]|nr:hypothetical protein MKW92_029108 [Papaver armeniacum]
MGHVSKAVHDGGRHVLGIIPKTLKPKELTGQSVGEVRVVSGMHQRKAEMARHADASIAVPGGYGTFEEILEAITWAQLGINRKPVGLLNIISPSARRIIVSAETAKQLVEGLEEFVPGYDELTASLVWEPESTTGVST